MEIFLARQPIFDLHEQVVGYELFYGGTASTAETGEEAYDRAQHVLADAFAGIGLERMTEGHSAYVKATVEMLLNGSVELLDPARVVAVVDAADAREPDVVDACRRLAEAGYRLALDDFVFTPASEPLLRLASMAKVNVRLQSREYLERLVGRLRPFELELLADGVENRSVRDRCIELGFTLFQGYRFTQPEVISKRDLGVEYLQIFQLMKQIRDPDTPDSVIEEGFRRDLSLTYKLLRIVNSAAVGLREISSVGQAIRILGRAQLGRWLALLILSSEGSEGGVKEELASEALLRGRLCELLAAPSGQAGARGTLFIVGLFSLLDLLLDTPMEEIVAEMSFPDEVNAALLRREGPLGEVLAVAEAYEAGRWDEVRERCARLGIEEYVLSGCYFEALRWAEEQQAPAHSA